jgi:hypothetical protein
MASLILIKFFGAAPDAATGLAKSIDGTSILPRIGVRLFAWPRGPVFPGAPRAR